MKNLHIYLILIFISLLSSACNLQRQLTKHESKLQHLAHDSSISAEQKLDGLSQELVLMLEETIKINSTRKAVKYVDQFVSTNDQEIELIGKEVEKWMNGLSPAEKIVVGIKLAAKPQTRRLIELIPVVEKKIGRKIKRLILIYKIMSFFGLGL